jgi:hypothetical protein
MPYPAAWFRDEARLGADSVGKGKQKSIREKIRYSPWIDRLSERPALERPVLKAYHQWLRLSYRPLWRWNNLAARRAFQAGPPVLDSVQQRIVDSLRDSGIAVVSFAELFGSNGRFQQLSAGVNEWLASDEVVAAEREFLEEGYKHAHFKEYLVRLYGREKGGVAMPWDSPWLRLSVDSKVLDVANSYFEMTTRMYHVDLWNTIAAPHADRRVGPQRWHRDPADVQLLKVFLYFSDVDLDSGAMQYVPHSRPGEKYGTLWRQDPPFDGARPPEEEFSQKVPPSDWTTCSHPAGTLVFADTAGFHRGGWAQSRNRVLATWAYSSPASRWPRRFHLDEQNIPADLGPTARMALGLEGSRADKINAA